jgi:putative ABC transport system permease protein
VIISQSLAHEYWPHEDPIGQQIQPKLPGAPPTTVIGVAGDVRHWSRDVAVQPTAYYPFTQAPAAVRPLVLQYMSVALRTRLAPEALLPSVRSAAADLDKTAPIYDVRTMDSLVADSSSLRRFAMSLVATFAGLALALAAIGVYGVMAYSVTQRTREIGIRFALGASRTDVLRLIVSHAVRLGAIGVASGVIAAVALARVMATLVYGVSPRDVMTFSIAAGFVMAVILLAGYVPARRATRVEPLDALRAE